MNFTLFDMQTDYRFACFRMSATANW